MTLGEERFWQKMDIKSAFRLLIIHPADFDLMGIKIGDSYYIDKCLPMGCSLSCKLFETFSTFIQWEVERRSPSNLIDHYLDDFIFMGAGHSNDCTLLMSTFKEVCQELGVPLAEKKTMGPCTLLPFLGFLIDTEELRILIPPEKLEKLKSLLNTLLLKKKACLRELESVTGLMSFCSRAIPSSRAFIRRFYDLLGSGYKPHHKIKITAEVKADIAMWLQFLDEFNGHCFFPERIWTSNIILHLFTDSSGNPELGCGAIFGQRWAQFRWPRSWKRAQFMKDMSFLEMVPVVLALYLWADKLSNKKILFHIDNLALVSILNKRSSKDKLIMKLIRPFVLLIMLNNVQFRTVHIEGVKNDIADSISRFQMSRFRSLAPEADVSPAVLSMEFLTLISSL